MTLATVVESTKGLRRFTEMFLHVSTSGSMATPQRDRKVGHLENIFDSPSGFLLAVRLFAILWAFLRWMWICKPKSFWSMGCPERSESLISLAETPKGKSEILVNIILCTVGVV